MQPAAILSILVRAQGVSAATGELRALEGAAKKAGAATETMGKRTRSSFNGVLGSTAKFAAAGAGIYAVTRGIKSLGQATVGFDKSMRNVNSIAGLSEKQFASLERQVLRLAGKTAQAPQTLADGLYDLESSGFNAKQSMTILASSAKAATAGLTDTKTSTAAVAAVLNAYRRPAKDAAKVSDDLFQTVNRGVITFPELAQNIGDVLPFASSLGVGLKQVGAAISTMTKEGISAPETMTRIKSIMQSMLKPSNALAEAIKQTGASSGEALIQQKGFQGALEALIKTTDGSKGSIAKMFPNVRALGGALALTGKNASTAHQDLAGFANTSGATNTVLAEQAKSASYQWNKLKATIAAFGITLGLQVLPVVARVLQFLSGLNPVLQQNKSLVMIVVGALGALAAGTVAVNLAMAANPFVAAGVALAALVIGIVKAYQTSATFRGVVLAVFNAIRTAFTATVAAISAATSAVVNEVKQWDTLWSGIKRVFGLIAAGARLLFSILKTVFQAGMIPLGPIVVAGWALIKGIFSGAWTAIKGIVVGGFTVLRGVVKVIGGLFKGDFRQVWDGVKTIFSGALTALKGILAGAWKILKAPVDAIGAGLHDAFSNTWGRIKGVFRDGVNAVIDFLNVLISAINAIPGIPDIKKIGHVGAGGGGGSMAANNKAAAGQQNLGGSGHLARGGAFARTKGLINRPMTFMGEEAPAHPEYIIPTNPAYRGRAVGLLGQAAKAIGLAQGGVYSQSQLAALWSRVNPGNGNPQLMAAIAEAESRGRVNARNGPYNGLWQVGPGGPFDPVANARAAGVKLRTQGLSAWETYTNGSYKQFLGGGGGVLGAIGGFIGNAADTVKHLLGKLPSPSGLGMFAGLGKYVVGKAKDYIKGAVGSLFSSGGGGGASSGPNGVGNFAGVPMANWVIQSLQYAQRKLGIALHPTSGYRPGSDPHTASGSSEHSGTQYPHGAVDFGGYHDPRALATKMAVVNATRDFRWPLLAPMGFVDDGHASGTGHYKGGVWGGYAGGTGGAVKGMAWVGEKGPELVNFKGGEQVFSHGASMSLANQRRIIAMRAPHKGVVRNLNTGGPATTDVSTATDTGTGGDPNQPLIDAITAQTAIDQALGDALKGVKASIDAQTAFATSVSNTSNFQLTKMLSDLISGHIVGTGVAGRAFTPGTGVEHVY